MKKFIFIIMLAVTSSMALVSCTEETVEPSNTEQGGSDGNQDGKI